MLINKVKNNWINFKVSFACDFLYVEAHWCKASTTLVVLTCIYWCVLDRRSRSPAKSESYSRMQAVHFIPCFASNVEVFIIQRNIRRKRKGESKQRCMTPIFTWISSLNCHSCTTLQCHLSYEFCMMMTIWGTP